MKKILKSLLYPLREIKDYFFWLSVPDKELRNNGIFVEENFFDEKLCDNLVEQANTLISDKSKMLGENSWLYVRANNDEGRDTKVKQFVDSRKILNLFERKLGKKLVMRNCSMMVDEPDTETKRSFHSDNNPPASFKAFIYLTDVLSEKNGPFSVIVGTHRAHYLRAKNVISNIMNDRKVSDLETYLPKQEETAFIGKKGTAIFSTQTAFHRGNPKHSEKTRYMLVFYLSLESEGPYGEFNLGRES